MHKTFYILLLASLISLQSSAQKSDTLVYYLKSYGILVKTIDSADFIRVITAPDRTDKTGLFKVTDVYRDGKKKMVATSHNSSYVLNLEGPCLSYFPNGHRERIMNYVKGRSQGQGIEYYINGHQKSVMNYNEGRLYGEATEYYPNGQLYAIKKYNNIQEATLIECRDSTGKVLAANGNGTWLDMTDDHTIGYQQGPIVKGERKGAWVKFIDDKQFPFEYKGGKALLAVNYDRSGEVVTGLDIPPAFPDNKYGFMDYLAQTVRYPLQSHSNNSSGIVWVSFVVEKDGSLSDIKADGEVSKPLDDEAINVVKKSPLWIPGFVNGKAVRTLYKCPICFYLDEADITKAPPGAVFIYAGNSVTIGR